MVFLRTQRKSIKEDASKGLRSNGATRCLQNFGENPQTNGVHEFILFFTGRSFTADGGLLSPTGSVKTTPQKTRFRDEKYARIWDTDRVDDDRTQSDYNILKERTSHLVLRLRGEMQLTNKTILLDVEASDTNDNVKTKIQRINTKHNMNT